MQQRHNKKNRTEPTPGISEQLRSWRVHKGLRQGELEERAGLSHNAVSRIENGKVSPKLETVERLAVSLGIGIEQLQFKIPPKGSNSHVLDADVQNLVKRLENITLNQRRGLIKTFSEILDLLEGGP